MTICIHALVYWYMLCVSLLIITGRTNVRGRMADLS